MERQEIEVFLVVAEELHFRRAAERLRVAPARITQLIQKTERRIGAPLFTRSPRAVGLTDIGKLLRDELSPAHAAVQAAIDHATEAARQPAGNLRLGFLGPTTGEHLTDLADACARRHPGTEARVVLEAEIGDPLGPLRAGRVDLLAIHLPIAEPDLVIGPVILREQLMLVVHVSNPLAQRATASLEDLHGHPIIATAATAPDSWQERFVPTATPSGRTIGPISRVDSIQAGITLAAAGKGIGLILEQYARYNRRPSLVYLPVADAPVCEVALIWRADRETALVRSFARLAEEFGPAVDRPRPQ